MFTLSLGNASSLYDAAKNDAAKLKELKADLETAIGAKLGYNASRILVTAINGNKLARRRRASTDLKVDFTVEPKKGEELSVADVKNALSKDAKLDVGERQFLVSTAAAEESGDLTGLPPPSPSSSGSGSSAGAVAGAIIGTLAVIGLIVGAVYVYRTRKNLQRRTNNQGAEMGAIGSVRSARAPDPNLGVC